MTGLSGVLKEHDDLPSTSFTLEHCFTFDAKHPVYHVYMTIVDVEQRFTQAYELQSWNYCDETGQDRFEAEVNELTEHLMAYGADKTIRHLLRT